MILLKGILPVLGIWCFIYNSFALAETLNTSQQDADKAHEAVFLEAGDKFPSAQECKACHPDHYREWSVSPHAYAQMSPVFNAMHGTIVKLTNGTNGDFCIRCHTSTGMALDEPLFVSNEQRHITSREGITCITCHRINQAYGKISGRMNINEGDIYSTVYGPEGGAELNRVRETFGLAAERDQERRQDVHLKTENFFQLPTSGFCGSCHDVNLLNGFRLEEAFSEFKNTPAAKRGVTCQDCHMGEVQGIFVSDSLLFHLDFDQTGDIGQNVLSEDIQQAFAARGIDLSAQATLQFEENTDSGLILDEVNGQTYHIERLKEQLAVILKRNYRYGPAAAVRGKRTISRKLTSHLFAGPDHSIIHPGIFPHNSQASTFENINGDKADITAWLSYDYKAGWGTKGFDGTIDEYFEDNHIPEGYHFPEFWSDPEDRYNARAVLDSQFVLLDMYMTKRQEVLRNGYSLDEPVLEQADRKSIRYKVNVRNITDGHNVPTGFDAERLVFIQTTVVDSRGDTVFVSGDLDPNGDIRDAHSVYVHNGELPKDKYLFNLQSKFITRMVRGGEREQVLAVNYSPDPLPFLRPATQATTLTGRPGGVRKHRQTIPPFKGKWAKYKVNSAAMSDSIGLYRINIRLISGMVPVNLVHEIQEVGFDYNMSPRQVADEIVKRHAVLWEWETTVDVGQKNGSKNSRWERKELTPGPWNR